MQLFSNNKLTSTFSSFFKQKATLVYWCMLILIVAMEVLVIRHSASVILASNRAPEQLPTSKGVRVNFTNYKAVVDRIVKNQSYIPPYEPLVSPFKNSK